MSVVIASQLEPAINAILAGHASRPTVIMAPEQDPWSIATQADVLIVRPTPACRNAPRDVMPPRWPGRLRWVFSCSVGVDFYPGWLLDGPSVSCARGTVSEEIADYVIAAIYAHAKDLTSAAVRSPQDWQYRELGRVVDSTVGVIGLGAIGTAVARRAAALGARVLAVRRSRTGMIGVIGVEMRDSQRSLQSRSHLAAMIVADRICVGNGYPALGRLVQQPPPVRPHRIHPTRRGRSQLLSSP